MRLEKRRGGVLWIALAILVVVAAVLIVGGRYYLKSRAKQEVDNFVEANKTKANIKYQGLDINWTDMGGKIRNVEVQPKGVKGTIQIDEVQVSNVDAKHQPPHRLDINLKGINLGSEAFKNLPAEKGDAPKLPNSKADLAVRYQFNPETKDFVLENMVVDAKGLGRLKTSVALKNIEFDLLSDPKKQFMFLMTLPQIALESAEFEFKDDGLFNRVLHEQAMEKNKSVDEIKQDMLAELDEDIAKATDPETRKSLNELKRFIQKPGRIRITVKPDAPVSLMQVQNSEDPSQAADIFNVKIRYE